MKRVILAVCNIALLAALGLGCSGKKVKPLTLSELQGKRVALTEIEGSGETRMHVEVAIINEILDEGRFEIVDRASVHEALAFYPTDSDWQRLGQKVGADYVLSIKIKEFTVKERTGYDKVVEEDSVLTEESGESKPVLGTRYEKVKGYEGKVVLDTSFYNVERGAIAYHELAAASGSLNSRDKNKPRDKDNKTPGFGKLQLLEHLTTQAIHSFFEKIPK